MSLRSDPHGSVLAPTVATKQNINLHLQLAICHCIRIRHGPGQDVAMADMRSVSSAVSGQISVGTGPCPLVADLITYALGQCGNEERQRVEAHLKETDCSQCRGWLDKAARYRSDAWPAEPAALTPAAPLLRSPPASTANQTPIPPSSKWQRQAFQDLEERLRQLEENQG